MILTASQHACHTIADPRSDQYVRCWQMQSAAAIPWEHFCAHVSVHVVLGWPLLYYVAPRTVHISSAAATTASNAIHSRACTSYHQLQQGSQPQMQVLTFREM